MRRLACILLIALLAAPTAAQQFEAGEAQLTPRQALRAKISEVRFENASLRDSIDWMRSTLGTNIHVDWGALAEVGVTPDDPINIRLRWVQVPRLLRLVFQETGQGDALIYYVSGNILMITTRTQADADVITRSYPVQDLLLQPGPVDRPDANVLAGAGSNARSGRGGSGSSGFGGGSGGGFGGGSSGSGLFGSQDRDRDRETDRPEARAEELIEMIKQLTPADAWRENGGTATIAYFRGHLIVTGPRSLHELIGGPVRE